MSKQNIQQSVQQMAGVMLPMIRQITPSLIAQQIIGVQPMTGVGSSMFNIKASYRYRKPPQAHNRSRRARLYRLWRDGRIRLMPKRRTKGHWTELRVLFSDERYRQVASNLRASWRELQTEDWGWSAGHQFWDWLQGIVEPLGGRVVYDIRYDTKALHMDSHEALIQLMLTWGGAQ